MFKIRSMMRTETITVKKTTPIYEAMRLLVDKGISGLPVVDDQMMIEGILTEKDCLRLLIDDAVGENQTVEQFMTRKVISFRPDDSVLDVCDFFLNHTPRRVPIVEDGKLAGIVSRRDIIVQILKRRGK